MFRNRLIILIKNMKFINRKSYIAAPLCALLFTACSDIDTVSLSDTSYGISSESTAITEIISEAASKSTADDPQNIYRNGMLCFITDDIPVDENGVHDIRCFGTHIITDEHSLKRRTDILGNDKTGSELEKYFADTDFENEYIACTLIPVN